MKTGRKIMLILGAGAGAVVVAVLAFVLLLPRLVDLDRVKARAVAVVSEQAGAAVRFDRVAFSYFPRPHVVISGVEADWQDNAEIAIPSLVIYPRLRSLLSGEFLIRKVTAESPALTVRVDFLKRPSEEDFDAAVLKFLGQLSLLAPSLELSVRDGTLDLMKAYGTGLTVRKIDATMYFSGSAAELTAEAETGFAQAIAARLSMQEKGGSFDRISLVVTAREVDVGTARDRERGLSFAGELPVARAIFSYLQEGTFSSVVIRSEAPSFRDLGTSEHMVIEGKLGRGSVVIPEPALEFGSVTGRYVIEKGILHGEGIEGMIGGILLRKGSLTVGLVRGDAPFHLGVDTEAAAGDAVQLIARFVRTLPFPLDRLRTVGGTVKGRVTIGESTAIFRDWKGRGHLAFDGDVHLAGRRILDLAMTLKPEGLALNRIYLHDTVSDATIRLKRYEKAMGLEFDGVLSAETLDGVLELPQVRGGAINGHFSASVDLESPSGSVMRGSLSAAGIAVPLKDGGLLAVERMKLDADGSMIRIASASGKLDDTSFSASGTITPGQQGLTVDADVSLVRADLAVLKRLLPSRTAETPGIRKTADPSLKVAGVIRLKAQHVFWERFDMSSVSGKIMLADDSSEIEVAKASLCGLGLSGTASAGQCGVNALFVLRAEGQDLLPAVSCLTGQKSIYTGTYDLESVVKATGPPDRLVGSLDGTLEFTARDGRISRAPLLTKIFSLLNVTEIFFGTIPDITTEGFKFRSISVKGEIRKGRLVIKEAVLDGLTMKLVGSGEIDLASKTIELELLAAPLRTVDRIVGAIPVIREITGGSLIAVPVSVSGELGEPTVQYLPLKGIGKGLLRMMERIITLPVRIIEPLLPDEQKKRVRSKEQTVNSSRTVKSLKQRATSKDSKKHEDCKESASGQPKKSWFGNA